MSELYIVMPVINCLDLTKAAFNSIQTEKKWTFILVDQESNDGTQEWGEKMEIIVNGHKAMDKIGIGSSPLGNLENFIYMRNSPRLSLSAAWNKAIKLAFEDPECKYVFVPNNDIILHPKTIDHLIAFMDHTGYLMVTGDNIKDRMSPEVMAQMELPTPFTDFDTWEISDWRAEGPDFSCFLINRETIRVVGWFDENFQGAYCEDQDYHARINRAWRHIKEHRDQGIDPIKVHAKRLSTAPYYHFASQTISGNPSLRVNISDMHRRNHEYYIHKWGGEHPTVMDGLCNITPFGDATKNWRDW